MFLTFDDLAPLTDADTSALIVMIEDVEALAVESAPCLAAPGALTAAQTAAVRAVLRGAVLRWAERTMRDDRQMIAGPYSVGPVPGSQGERKPLLWPSEVGQLQGVCAAVTGRASSRVGSVRLAAPAWWVR